VERSAAKLLSTLLLASGLEKVSVGVCSRERRIFEHLL